MSERRDECRYCNTKSAHGYGCAFGPEGIHVEVGDSEHCIFCGATNYGAGCYYNNGKILGHIPQGFHVHGHGDRKCIWCGQVGISGSCAFSPSGKHQL